ncbi:hypothetical protein ACAY19_002305 [Serratia liquefaciens]
MNNKLSELSKPVGYAAKEDIELMQSGRMTLGLLTIRGYGELALYSQEYVSALLADNEAKDKRIAELEAKTAMTMGVGNGGGSLFVHGDYDSIKAAQSIVFENESLRAKLATPVRLPEPCVYEVNGTRFYDRLSEAEVIASLRKQGFTAGDE